VTPPARNLAWIAKHHFGKLRLANFVLCGSPALWLLGEAVFGSLGINPLNRLLHTTGRWSLTMLLVTLGVTPLRRLSVRLSQVAHARFGKRVSDWNWLVRLRRQFGLFAFFYAGLHVLIYVALDTGFDAAALRDDLRQRPFVLLGAAAFVLLVPLAATSNQVAMRALGRHWRRLHTLAYPIAVMALVHFWLQAKPGQPRPIAFAIVVVLLLGSRIVAWRAGERGKAVEEPERAPDAITADRPAPKTLAAVPVRIAPGALERQPPGVRRDELVDRLRSP